MKQAQYLYNFRIYSLPKKRGKEQFLLIHTGATHPVLVLGLGLACQRETLLSLAPMEAPAQANLILFWHLNYRTNCHCCYLFTCGQGEIVTIIHVVFHQKKLPTNSSIYPKLLLACSMRSEGLCVYSLPGSSLCGSGVGGSTGSRQTLYVETQRFLCCCRSLQDLHQHLT